MNDKEKDKDKSWATAEDVAKLAGVSRSAMARLASKGPQ